MHASKLYFSITDISSRMNDTDERYIHVYMGTVWSIYYMYCSDADSDLETLLASEVSQLVYDESSSGR